MPSYSVSLREELNVKVTERASKKGLSVADYLRQLAEEDIKKEKKDVWSGLR